MNISELTETWKNLLDHMSEDPQLKIKVDSWFRPLEPFKIDDEKGVIYCTSQDDNNFSRGLIKRNENIFKKATREFLNKEYIIEISSNDSQEDTPDNSLNEDAGDDYLIPRYTFENFITGPNNRLAMAACLAVADGYSKEYNPLFLYGGSGLGKTHLLHSISQYVNKNQKNRRVLYVSSEVFTNELIKSIQEKKTEEFRNKYRKLDILLIDDIQFIAGKPQTEEEVFHTFEALYNAGKQIVFSSDKPPKDLGTMPERLISRFSWGMIADIQPPDYETRVAILTNKAAQDGITVDSDMKEVIDAIAQSIPSNIRELEGAFTRVVAHGALLNEKITKELAERVLTDVFNTKSRDINSSGIKKAVAEYFGIKTSDMESKNRSRNIAYPRQVAIYLIREFTNLSLPKIGEEFGGRDHTTIMHSYEKISEDIKTNADLKNTIDNIKRHLNL